MGVCGISGELSGRSTIEALESLDGGLNSVEVGPKVVYAGVKI